MHFLPPQGAGHHLHRSAGIIPPAGDLDFGKPGVPSWKQRGMPAEQACLCHRRRTVRRRIEHHLDHAFDMTIRRCQSANIHAQAAGDAGADGSDVQLLAFDLAGFDDILATRLA